MIIRICSVGLEFHRVELKQTILVHRLNATRKAYVCLDTFMASAQVCVLLAAVNLADATIICDYKTLAL